MHFYVQKLNSTIKTTQNVKKILKAFIKHVINLKLIQYVIMYQFTLIHYLNKLTPQTPTTI